ncbi:MAG: helix-turn-helix transcriptional regulator, partial [Devosia sp.]
MKDVQNILPAQVSPSFGATAGQASGEDEAAIWRAIESDHIAFWSQNYPAWARFHSQAPYEQFWGWAPESGVTIHKGWEAISKAMLDHIAVVPDPMPYFFDIQRENKTIRIVGDVAWVTFDELCPTDDLPDFRGPGGRVNLLRILERRPDGWKIVFAGLLDTQFGQTTIPSWQIDRTGRVLRQNAAATQFMRTESEMAVQAGRMHMRGSESDRRFRATVDLLADPVGCFLFGSDAAPFVYDPGNDEPARIWWIVARSGELTVSFNDPVLIQGRIEIAANAFGLSPSQQRLAMSIVSGLPVTEAAKREGIRPSSARTQLQRIYDKVGVRTQSALVQALMAATAAG